MGYRVTRYSAIAFKVHVLESDGLDRGLDINHTSTEHAPWYIVPADRKWYARLVVAAVIQQTMEQLNLAYPEITQAQRQALVQARQMLEAEH
ncbi:hypothetical protein H6F80_13370 [Leptolyngbya sp. FACHB-711]|nr:hypothetical protein [Leptolyngbya sp. FACHB-711]